MRTMACLAFSARRLKIARAAKQEAAPVQKQEDWESAAERLKALWEMGEESEGDDTDDECKMTDTEEEDDPDQDSLEELMQNAVTPGAFDAQFRYKRGSISSQKPRRRKEKQIEAKKELSKRCKPLTSYLRLAKQKAAPMDSVGVANREQLNEMEQETAYKERICNTAGKSTVEVQQEVREGKIRQLDKQVRSTDRTSRLKGPNLNCHRSVLACFYIQPSKQPGETRSSMTTIFANTFNRGTYFACKIVTWEISWLKNGFIDEGRQGCFAKTRSWVDDKGVMLHVRE
jgi:hypothetical protein